MRNPKPKGYCLDMVDDAIRYLHCSRLEITAIFIGPCRLAG